MSDAARKLGEKLLAASKLTTGDVRSAVSDARKEAADERQQRRLRTLLTQASLIVRMADAEKRTRELRKVIGWIVDTLDGKDVTDAAMQPEQQPTRGESRRVDAVQNGERDGRDSTPVPAVGSRVD